MSIWQLCANLLIPNCLRSNLSYSPLAALELYVISLKSVIEWIDNVINEELSPYKTLEVNIFPNLATKELLGDNLKLPRKDIDRCYIIIIHETGTQKVIKRKLVVSNHVAEDLTAIKEGKIFKFPVE